MLLKQQTFHTIAWNKGLMQPIQATPLAYGFLIFRLSV